MEEAVSMYAHDSEDKPVCVLLKRKVNISTLLIFDYIIKFQDKSYSVSCKCADRQLAQSIVEDIIDVIRKL